MHRSFADAPAPFGNTVPLHAMAHVALFGHWQNLEEPHGPCGLMKCCKAHRCLAGDTDTLGARSRSTHE